MKHTKQCPKCGCKQLIQADIPWDNGGQYRYLHTGWTCLSSIPITMYICSECGFTEEWIRDTEDIPKLFDRYDYQK